jgi:hypothetical protein
MVSMYFSSGLWAVVMTFVIGKFFSRNRRTGLSALPSSEVNDNCHPSGVFGMSMPRGCGKWDRKGTLFVVKVAKTEYVEIGAWERKSLAFSDPCVFERFV